jgi:peptidoglycan/xylan/chitin deacetylase (PgdA/CDA1 family)
LTKKTLPIKKPGKREALARWLHAVGIQSVLNRLPQRNSLLVINYHRVGDADSTPYDSGVFSATADEFKAQMEYVAENLRPVTLPEALLFLEREEERNGRCRVLITFDDGYIDNFQIAFPILRRLGMQGVFFLPTSFIGTREVPWWDRVSYIVKSARNLRFELRRPNAIKFDLRASGAREVARQIVNLLRLSPPGDLERAVGELERVCDGASPDTSIDRCFMNWDEVRQLVEGGMTVGAHTHTHRMLAPLSEEEQRKELVESRSMLRDRLRSAVETVAYPLGAECSFTSETMRLARQTGYRAAFSFYGGLNRAGRTERFNVLRVAVDGQSVERFGTQSTMAALTDRFWP